MNKKYTQEEINGIMQSKELNEFYLAVIENRGELLTDEEYNDIKNREVKYTEDIKDDMDKLVDKIKTDDNLRKFSDEIMKALFSVGQIRYLAILTLVDDEVYDISNCNFPDLKRNKIICYDNLTDYYDETNARIRVFTKTEVPQLKEPSALLDIDSEDQIRDYEQNYINIVKSYDLTEAFLNEIKGNSYTLKK